MNTSVFSPLSPVPAQVSFVLSVLRSSLPALPPGGCLARVVVSVGQPAALVSASGADLVPSSWCLVSSVAGEGGWLVLAPVQPVASQLSLF